MFAAFAEAANQLSEVYAELARAAKSYQNNSIQMVSGRLINSLDRYERARGVLNHHVAMHSCRNTNCSDEGLKTDAGKARLLKIPQIPQFRESYRAYIS